MREKGQNEVAKTLETPVFSRGREILTEKFKLPKCKLHQNEAVKGEDGSREQEVEIFYRFIGKID